MSEVLIFVMLLSTRFKMWKSGHL
ncbi:KxYKxGKxW signal peptide domain-containing protein [Salinimonas lutimaris]